MSLDAATVATQLRDLAKVPQNRGPIVRDQGCLPGLVLFLGNPDQTVVDVAVEAMVLHVVSIDALCFTIDIPTLWAVTWMCPPNINYQTHMKSRRGFLLNMTEIETLCGMSLVWNHEHCCTICGAWNLFICDPELCLSPNFNAICNRSCRSRYQLEQYYWRCQYFARGELCKYNSNTIL